MRRNIAQPALSRKIQIIENCLGASIFDRNRKGVETTAFGKMCLKLLLAWRNEGLATSRKIAENIGKQITIKLGTYDSVGIYFFPRLLKMVKAAQLNCNVELHLNRSREIVRNVSEGSLDLGLVFFGGLTSANLKVKPVAMDEYGFFESATPRSSNDFYTLVNSTDDQGHTIEDFLKTFGLQHHRLVDSPSFEVAAALTLAGLGIGILPVRVAQRYVRQHKLKQIEFGKVRNFGRHHLSVVRALNNKDNTIEKVAQLIEAGFLASSS